MNNTIEYDLRKSLESFEKSLENKKVEGGTEIEIFTQIEKDIEKLDQAVYNQIVAEIQLVIAHEYEERDYILDSALHEGAITEEDFERFSSEPIEYDFEYLGISDTYDEGLFGSGSLGMYAVYRGLYQNKCYNINDEYFLLNTFNRYEKILDKIFDKYSQFTNMNSFDSMKRFEELFKNNLIF